MLAITILAPRVPPGATRAARQRRAAPPAAIGSSTYAYSSARQSAAQHSRSQRFLVAALSLFVQRLSRRLSCSLCLPVPPSSSLPSPFPLTVSRLSLPPSPFVCPWPAFFSSLRSSNVSLSLCPCRLPAAKRVASELDRAKRGGRCRARSCIRRYEALLRPTLSLCASLREFH